MKTTRLFSLIGVFLFIYILLNIDVVKTLEILSGANLFLIVLSIVVMIPTLFLKFIKWKMFIGLYDKRYPFRNVIKSWFIGFSISMVTPARIGDLSRAYCIKDKIGLGKGITTVVADRVIDIAVLFCLAIIGLVSFVAFFTEHSNLLLTVSVFFALFILGVYISTKKEIIKALLRPVFKKFVPEKHKSEINITFNDFYRGLNSLKGSRKTIVLAIVLSFLFWIFSIFQFFLLSVSIGLSVSYIFLFSVLPIIAILDALPISFSGIGTRDAALIFFLSFVSVRMEYAISLSFLLFVFGYLLPGLIGVFIMLKEHTKL